MFKNSEEFPVKFTQISHVPELYPEGQGFSWRKIPSVLFDLASSIGAKSSDTLVALALANHTARTRTFPLFSLEQSKIAEVTGLSPRAISNSIKFLASNKVLSVRYSNGMSNQYKWNEEFLRGTAPVSVVPVNEVQRGYCNSFSGTTETGARIYIEFSLDLFINTFKEFFAEHQPPYRFYVPKKRVKKDTPQGSGETITVSRVDAWRDAVFTVYEEIKNSNDALVRIYLALRASNNIQDVNFPKAALRYRVNDWESMNESRSKSHLREFLHSDEDFKDFINKQLSERRH